MLVQLASQYPTQETQIQHSDRQCRAEPLSTGSSDECRNMSSIRPSPKSPALQLLSSHSSAWPCSERRLASFKPTQPGHPSVGQSNINCHINQTANHPATVAVHQAVMEPYSAGNMLIYLSRDSVTAARTWNNLSTHVQSAPRLSVG